MTTCAASGALASGGLAPLESGAVDGWGLQRQEAWRVPRAGHGRHLKDGFHLPPAQPHLAVESMSHRKSGDRVVCVGDSMRGAPREGGSWIWGEVGVLA